jgi:putative NIF3 family GTP cyclohydrolase 1 type 2
MTAAVDRLDLRLSAEDKERIRRAAALQGMAVAAFVREAALREAEATITHSLKAHGGSLAARLRGAATAHMSTDEIMRLTRGA